MPGSPKPSKVRSQPAAKFDRFTTLVLVIAIVMTAIVLIRLGPATAMERLFVTF